MQTAPQKIPIALSGGVVTSREKTSLPFGSFSELTNIRWRHPGFEKRSGQRPLHTTPDSTNEVLSIYQFKKTEVDEKHLYAQMSDGGLLEATNQPPIISSGVFGDEVFSGSLNQIPASYSKINDILIVSNGVDQHQVYGGNRGYIEKLIVYKGSVSFPAFPQIGEDYSNQISDGQALTVAVLDILGAYSSYQCLFIKTPVQAKSFTITFVKPNTSVADVSIYYYNSAWTTIGAVADSTKLGATTFAQSGTLAFTAPTDMQSKYQFGSNGWWYQIGFSAKLGSEVEISSITYDSDFHDIANIWDGVPVNAVEVYVETSPTDIGSDLITNGDFISGISDWDDLSTGDGSFAWDTDHAELDANTGTAVMGQTVSVATNHLSRIIFTIAENCTGLTVTGGSSAYGGTEHFTETYTSIGEKTIEFTTSGASLYLQFASSTNEVVSLDDITLYPTAQGYEVYASGAVDIGALAAGKKIKIGTSYKLEGIYIDTGNTPNLCISSTPTPTVNYWNGNSNISVGAITDESHGMTSAGYLLFPRKTDVQPSNFEGSFHYINWYELSWSEDITANTVIEITLVPFFDIEDFGKSQCSCVWKDRAVITFNKWGNDIYVSRTREPQMYNGADFAILSAGDGRKNKVVAMRSYYSELMVWQEDTGAEGGCLTLFEGYSPTTFGKLVLSTKLGTFNNNCVVLVDGVSIATKTDESVRTVVYFLSRQGVCMSDGRTVQIISDDIQNYFDPTKSECISKKYAHRMWLNHDSAENVLRIGLVSGSAAIEANVFPVYDLIDKCWSFDIYAQNLTCMTEIETGDEADYPMIQIGGTSGYVYQLNYRKNDNETEIPCTIAAEIDTLGEEIQLSAITTRIKDS